MTGFGSVGHGGVAGSSASSSNLSALAPPFTVDWSNPKPNSHPFNHFTEPTYAASFTGNWVYPHSSASRPDYFANPELGVDLVDTTCMPSANDYVGYSFTELSNSQGAHCSAINAGPKIAKDVLSYAVESKPYYPQYVSSMADDDTPLVAITEPSYDLLSTTGLASSGGSTSSSGGSTSPVDYTQSLAGLEYPPPWGGVWNGPADGKHGKRRELDRGFGLEKTIATASHVYINNITHGALAKENLSNYKVDSTIAHAKCTIDRGTGNQSKPLITGNLGNRSVLAQNLTFILDESSTVPILECGSVTSESHLQASLEEPASNVQNPHKQSTMKENVFNPLDPCVVDCISGKRSSPSIVIRSPVSNVPSSASSVTSSRTISVGNFKNLKGDNFSDYNFLKGKEPHLSLVSDHTDASPLNFGHDADVGDFFVSPSLVVAEQSNKLLTEDMLGQAFEPGSAFQIPDINVPDDLPVNVDRAEAKSSENSSNGVDPYNNAVDSPCWKGAPASQFVSFENFEALIPQHPMKKLEAFNPEDLQGMQFSAPVEASSQKSFDNNMHDENGFVNDSSSLSPNRTSEANFMAGEHLSGDAAQSNCQKMWSNGVQCSGDFENARKEYGLSNESCGFNPQPSHIDQLAVVDDNSISKLKLELPASVAQVVTNINDSSAGGCFSVHAVDSYSFSSGQNIAKPVEPHRAESPPQMYVEILVNIMDDLSRMLLFYSTSDACLMKEKIIEALKMVVRNLEACMPKKASHVTTEEPMFPQQSTSHQHEESELPNLYLGASVGRPQVTEKTASKIHASLNYQGEQKRHNVSGKKVHKIHNFVSVGNDTDSSSDDNMVQDIKRILEENFHAKEELPSEALLYKNLWLEAEAALCSISLRARFDRMKVTMEKSKSDEIVDMLGNNASVEKAPALQIDRMKVEKAKFKSDQVIDMSEITAAVKKAPTINFCTDPPISPTLTTEAGNSAIQDTSVQDSPFPGTTGHVDDVEPSVMTRFNILKRRVDNLNPLIDERQQQLDVVDAGSTAGGSEKETLKEFRVCVTDDHVIRPHTNSGSPNQLHAGWYDSSSSDWEHVL